MRSVTEYGFTFAIGSVCYSYLEMVCRGRTHWSMMLAGGMAMLCIYVLYKKMQPVGRLVRCLIGCFIITSMEFMIGIVLNRKLKLCVWDYSGLAFNLMGQVCPKYSALWFMLCFPADLLCSQIERHFASPSTQLCAK